MTDTRKEYARAYQSARLVKCYPPPKTIALVRVYAAVSNVSESELVSQALKAYFDSLPPCEKAKILAAL